MFREGTTIGAYRVVRQLGEGGMGAVYVGEHTLLGRKAAIKVLLPALSANHEFLQRFFNEARAVTQIADPGIVQVFDFGQDASGNAFIVMELLEGEAMDRRLERIGRFSPVDCLRLMRLICTSLGAAHAKGIVHRDLKPENILLVGDPAATGGERPKILDFGIAKLSTDQPGGMKTRVGTVMGTPVYMSPEQCRGAGDVDARSDIYASGCLMMTMLTGRPPFEAEGSGEIMAAHLREPPPLAASRIPGLPALFDQILQRCLAKSPPDRYPSMIELARTLGVAEHMMLPSAPAALVSELAAYASSGLTPPPGLAMSTLPPHLLQPGPTTLNGAVGQTTPPPRTRGPRFAVIAAVAGITIATGAIAIAALRGTPGAAAPAAARSPIAGPTLAIDAGLAPLLPVDGAVIAATVIDAALDVPAVVQPTDAGVPAVTQPKRTKHATSPGNHVHAPPPPAGSDVAPVDRGD